MVVGELVVDEVIGAAVDGVLGAVVSIEDGECEVSEPFSVAGAQATTARNAATGAARLIPTRRIYSQLVFGPLNGVRLALVIAAAVAGLVAMFAGFVVAGIVLLAGVGLHGAGWLYLYNHRYPDTTD